MRLYKLNDVVLNIKGHATTLLNGLSSNGLDQPLNAFLNQHGRIVATFRQQKISDDAFFIVVPSIATENLLRHLDRYAKLNRTQIQTTPLKAYIDVDTGGLWLKAQDVSSQVSDEEFTLFRLQKNIPLLGVDYQAEEFILNVSEDAYVSYTKGCFLGQEPVSKVHSRSKPTRKLIVKYEDECTDEEKASMTSKILDPQTRRMKGFVFVGNK
ncbi:MAG: hypothetical protein HY209_07955 [Candidatus Omnitrophica bacterium]|nr:hypothetical protein [Candidatus Omnitrophota bacterium]